MKIKRVDIYYFTGTGNTYLAAKTIAQVFENSGYVLSMNDIAKTDPKEVNLSNMLGVGFPIAFWNTFPVVKKFINNLPESRGTKVFVFATMGDFSLNAESGFGDILRNKGYCLVGVGGFLMPNNFIAVQKKEEKNIFKKERSYKRMESFAKKLVDETSTFTRPTLFFKICFVISGFITNRWQSSWFQKLVKFKVDKSKCIKCGLCVKICPVKNIAFDENYPVFNGKRCQICMRCISYCPTQSIKSFLVSRTYRALTEEDIKKCFM